MKLKSSGNLRLFFIALLFHYHLFPFFSGTIFFNQLLTYGNVLNKLKLCLKLSFQALQSHNEQLKWKKSSTNVNVKLEEFPLLLFLPLFFSNYFIFPFFFPSFLFSSSFPLFFALLSHPTFCLVSPFLYYSIYPVTVVLLNTGHETKYFKLASIGMC